MTVNSREKGKRAERALAKKLRDYGFDDCRRGQQFSGANGDADVVGLPNIHIEVKHRERGHGELYDWLGQANHDAKSGETPAVFHRKNNSEWLVTMTLDDWIELYRAYFFERKYNDSRLP